MAWGYPNDQGTAFGSVSSGTVNVGTTTTGNLLIVDIVEFIDGGNLNDPTVSDNSSNTLTKVTACAAFGGAKEKIWQYYAKNINGRSGHTVTVTPAGGSNFLNVMVSERSGGDTVSPLDQSATSTGNSSTITGGTVLVNNAGELVHGVASHDGGAAVQVVPSNLTDRVSLHTGGTGLSSDSADTETSSSFICQWTFAGPFNWGSVAASYKLAAAAAAAISIVPELFPGPVVMGDPFTQRVVPTESGLLIVRAPPVVPITITQQTAGKTGSAVTALADSFTMATQKNAGIVVLVGAKQNDPSSVTDSQGNTYSLVVNHNFFGADRTLIYYTPTAKGGSDTITVNFSSGTDCNFVACECSNSLGIDGSTGNSGNNPAAMRTTLLATQHLATIAFALMNDAHNIAQKPPWGFTNLYDDTVKVGSEASYQSLVAIQQLDALWVGSSTPQSNCLATFFSTGNTIPVPPPLAEIFAGPPLRGAPWLVRLLPTEAGLLVIAPPPALRTVPGIPELLQGPPMRGAPWLQRVVPTESGLLVVQAPAVITASPSFPLQEIYTGPPMRGAPWLQRLPHTEAGLLVIQAPPAPTQLPTVPVQEIVTGPPMRGAPWLGRLVPTESGLLVIQAPPVIITKVSAPLQEIFAGPPMRGAPWLARLLPTESGLLSIQGIAPVVTKGAAPIFEIFAGPPMRGAPWMARLPIEMLGLGSVRFPPAPPPIPGPGRGKAQPFLPRLPDASDERRLGRIMEKLSSFFNSLVSQAIIQQIGPSAWTLRPGGFTVNRPPGKNDDLTAGVNVGSVWVDTSAGKVWFCINNTVGAAVWTGPY